MAMAPVSGPEPNITTKNNAQTMVSTDRLVVTISFPSQKVAVFGVVFSAANSATGTETTCTSPGDEISLFSSKRRFRWVESSGFGPASSNRYRHIRFIAPFRGPVSSTGVDPESSI
jgi:hypothetical protein